MGWRFHKSFNFGFGFRVNISKNGVGYSWGIPGYRVTKKANGGYRTTYSIPGSGISYTEDIKSYNNLDINSKLPRPSSMERYNLENQSFYKIENGDVDVLTTPENVLFVKEIKTILTKNIWTWFLGALVLFIVVGIMSYFAPNFLIIPVISYFVVILPLCIFLTKRRFIYLQYDIDETYLEHIKKRNKSFEILSCCDKLWYIKECNYVTYSRVNAGASKNISRANAIFQLAKLPSYLKIDGNEKFFQLNIGNEKYIFLPDKILLINGLKVAALRYKDIEIELFDTRFVETDIAPNDSKFLYNTWQYVNNNGTPDRRFKNNKRLPVYLYEDVSIKSQTGLNIMLMVSDKSKAIEFKNIFNQLNEFL